MIFLGGNEASENELNFIRQSLDPPCRQRRLLRFRHSREGGNPVVIVEMPGLAPAGDLLSCSRKKVGKEALPAAPALRATLAAKGPPGRSLN